MENKTETHRIPVVILGAGMAGLSSSIAGGISSSFTIDGFTFDYGIHGIYSKNKDFLKFITEQVKGKQKEFRISISDYWKGRWTGHPIHLNLSKIPREEAAVYLIDFLQAKAIPTRTNINNFKEWCINDLGNKISEEFTFPYIRKFWSVEPEELTHEWMGERVKVPSVQEIVNGALLKSPPNLHYVKGVHYPLTAGFGNYATEMASNLNVQYNKKVISVDPSSKTLRFEDGESVKYEKIISTIPLPELIKIIDNVPDEIIKATSGLRTTSVMLINIGLSRPNSLKYHWVYSLDPEIPFARLSSPSMWSKKNAPKGMSSIQAEVYFSGIKPDVEMTFKAVIQSLEKMGILKSKEKLIVKDIKIWSYANIIHDHSRPFLIKKIHEYLRRKEIAFCGRYSFWDYSLIDEVSLKAQATAQEVINFLQDS
jgi:protoporphyrinogen oxidase